MQASTEMETKKEKIIKYEKNTNSAGSTY